MNSRIKQTSIVSGKTEGQTNGLLERIRILHVPEACSPVRIAVRGAA